MATEASKPPMSMISRPGSKLKVGAWAASLIGVSMPNSRLAQFSDDIERGNVLLMVDARASRLDEIRELVRRRHPEAMGGTMEPTLPAFP